MTKTKERLVIVTKFIPGGSLYHMLQNSSIDLPYSLLLKFAFDTARGVVNLDEISQIDVYRTFYTRKELFTET
jgi:serine/threonine protein kinase